MLQRLLVYFHQTDCLLVYGAIEHSVIQCISGCYKREPECGLLSCVSQKIVATKWWIYKGKISSPQDILCKSKR